MQISPRLAPFVFAALGVSVCANLALLARDPDAEAGEALAACRSSLSDRTAAAERATARLEEALMAARPLEDPTAPSPDGPPVGDNVGEAEAPTSAGALAAADAIPSADTVAGIADDEAVETARPSVATPAAAAGEVRVAGGAVTRSLPESLRATAGDDADAVAAVLSRVLMWDLQLRTDLRNGDRFRVAYTVDAAGIATVVGATYDSEKLGETLTAYRFRADGDRFARYYTADGQEVERRLRSSPIADYEQITSLLRDRPNHHGVDFMAPTGTPVVAPFAGRVTRVDWNQANNGHCVEVELADGTLAKFLHLESTAVSAGARVAAGATVGHSGNTGHSSGPHLHYQLNRGEAVLDPVDVHGTTRRQLDASQMAAFRAEVARIDGLLAEAAGK